MKKIVLPILCLIVGLAIGVMTSRDDHSGHDHSAAAETSTTWTCSMHPNVRAPEKGKCPICAMDLIPLGSLKTAGPLETILSPQAKALAGIETTKVVRQRVEKDVRMVGKIAVAETAVQSISARFPARIDRLYVDYTGIPVSSGDHLAQVYSPDLLTAQRELLITSRKELVREKLKLWGLTEGQVREIEDRGEPSDRLDIDAPASGIVIEKMINQGDYVKEGDPLFKIADLSKVWVLLDAFESDLSWLRFGQTVEFSAEAIPGEIFEGVIAFVPPTLDPVTRTVKIRVHAQNPNGRLKPGMFVRGVVKTVIGKGGGVTAPNLAGKWISPMHPEIVTDKPGDCPICGMDLVRAEELGYAEPMAEGDLPLTVPASAVLRTGKRAIVFVELPDKEEPTYQAREVVLGPRAGELYLVTKGISAGDSVVTEGAFRIDSELQIAAKMSMMNPGDKPRTEWDEWQPEATEFTEVLDQYLKLQKALADDNLSSAKSVASKIKSEPLLPLAKAIATAADLDGARLHFDQISNAMIEVSSRDDVVLPESVKKAYCPMAFKNAGADWLQSGDELLNPYFGAKMLNCGEFIP